MLPVQYQRNLACGTNEQALNIYLLCAAARKFASQWCPQVPENCKNPRNDPARAACACVLLRFPANELICLCVVPLCASVLVCFWPRVLLCLRACTLVRLCGCKLISVCAVCFFNVLRILT